MKLVAIAVLVHPFSILGFTALALALPSTLQALANQGPHGLSEVLYAYTSATANNGSAFGGLSARAIAP
jgi:K+-transporting ATPase ATPase A chain